MKKTYIFLVMITLSIAMMGFIVGCGSDSGDSTRIVLRLSANAVAVGGTCQGTATVTRGENPVNGVEVAWSADPEDGVTLSTTSSETDANGQATIDITAGNVEQAVTIQVRALQYASDTAELVIGQGGGEDTTGTVTLDADGNILENVTVNGANGGILFVAQGLNVNNASGDAPGSDFIVTFNDVVAATDARMDLTPDVCFSVIAGEEDDTLSYFFGEPRDEDDITVQAWGEVTLPLDFFDDLSESQPVFLFRRLSDVPEDDTDEDAALDETTVWSYLGQFVADEDGITFPVPHAGLYGVLLNDPTTWDRAGVTPPSNGVQLSQTFNGDMTTFVLIEPTTAEVLAAGVLDDPNASDRYDWQKGGSPDEPFYYKLTDNGDGTTTLDVRSEFSNRPIIRAFDRRGNKTERLMDAPKQVVDGEVVDAPYSPCSAVPRAGFILVRITGNGRYRDAREVVKKLREKYGEENVTIKYARARNGQVFMDAHIQTQDHAWLAADHLNASGYSSAPYYGPLPGDLGTVDGMNSNLLEVNLP